MLRRTRLRMPCVCLAGIRGIRVFGPCPSSRRPLFNCSSVMSLDEAHLVGEPLATDMMIVAPKELDFVFKFRRRSRSGALGHLTLIGCT